jgi:hypothetical protein
LRFPNVDVGGGWLIFAFHRQKSRFIPRRPTACMSCI